MSQKKKKKHRLKGTIIFQLMNMQRIKIGSQKDLLPSATK
jgi:hypothetical protein